MEDAGGVNSRGFGISSTNLVVGDAFFGPAMEPRSHATIFSGGVAKDLGVLKGQVYSRANGANAIGQVVGFSGLKRDSSQSRAFLWTYQTGMRDIGTLGGSYAQANAINEAGFITGTAQTLAVAAVKTTHAFIYNPMGAGPAAMRDLGVLGGNSSYGMSAFTYATTLSSGTGGRSQNAAEPMSPISSPDQQAKMTPRRNFSECSARSVASDAACSMTHATPDALSSAPG